MTTIPPDHIKDSQELIADGEVYLYEITPSTGTGVLRIKPDNSVTWLGQEYTGIPMKMTGERRESDTGFSNPKLTIGQENMDLSLFKPLIAEGSLDNALVKKHTVLLDNLMNQRNIKETMIYRVKQVAGYSSVQINLILATYSDSLGFELPIKAYDQPDFPTVQM